MSLRFPSSSYSRALHSFPTRRSSDLELDNLRVVLVATRNPLNIGAAARIMANFGFQHLRVVKPYDVAFREARSAVGAASLDRKSTRLNSSHVSISYAVFCLKKKISYH